MFKKRGQHSTYHYQSVEFDHHVQQNSFTPKNQYKLDYIPLSSKKLVLFKTTELKSCINKKQIMSPLP